jgi:2',3'-cyclic-nucleotide 2'-phosphodiesterase (5'-nucleotidase family)
MFKKKMIICALSAAFMLTSCSSHYALTGVSRTRLLIDNRYDSVPDVAAQTFIKPYKLRVDSIMSPLVGRTAEYLSAYRPESPLSNLLSDILVWSSAKFNESPDFSVYNIGGMRAALAKGDVTYGDVLDVAPFENKICFLSLTGAKVLELFSEIAMVGGEGVSHGVNLVCSHGKLLSATLNGQPIVADKVYRIATLDYVAQGNDHLDAFKSGTNMIAPEDEKNNVRYFIMDYFHQMLDKGKIVDSKVEGRIKIVDNHE